MQYDVIRDKELQTVVNTVRTYMRHGWVPKGDLLESKSGYAQEMQRHPVKAAQQKQQANRQKSWIPWTKH